MSISWTLDTDGTMRFTVTSNGRSGEQWINRLEAYSGEELPDHTKYLLRSNDFVPTLGLKTEMVVVKYPLLEGKKVAVEEVRVAAAQRRLEAPNAEATYLVYTTLDYADLNSMGLDWIVVMNDYPNVPDRHGGLLCFKRGYFGRWFDARWGGPNHKWMGPGTVGFAFAVPSDSQA